MWKVALVLVIAVMGAVLTGCNKSGSGNFVADLIEPFSPPTPGQAARDAFHLYDADKRRRSVALISASPFGGEPPYVGLYRLLIDDPDPTVRAACAQALGEHGDTDDALLLTPLLKDLSAYVRWQTAQGLQKLHNPAAVQPLIDTLDDEDADVRQAAAFALGQYPQSTVFDALVGSLNDDNYGVVHAAEHSLNRLTGQELGADGSAWLAWAKPNRGTLFADQQPYGYFPYLKPPGFFRKMMFWDRYPAEPTPLPPVGLEG